MYIVVDLVVGEVAEGNVRAIDNCLQFKLRVESGELRECDGGVDLMGFVAEELEHGYGLYLVMGFAEHLSVEPDDGVGGDKELVG